MQFAQPMGSVGGAVERLHSGRNPESEMGGSHRLADASSLAGLALAFVAVLAVGALYFSGPIADSLLGPDPCGVVTGVVPDTACVRAHPDYYAYDPAAGSLTTRGMQIVETVDAFAWPAAGLAALAAVIMSGLALAAGTRRRRTAVAALIISSLIVMWVIVLVLGLAFGGGD